MKFRQKIIYALAGVFLITGIFCRGEGADDPREEITPEHVNALLTRIVNVEKQMQENVALYPRVTRVITLGNTGSGKSTLVHALGERQMIVGEDADGELFIDVNKKHMIDKFVINKGIVAGTSQPTSWFDPDTSLVFWDCPGFMDPSGTSKDIETLFAIDRLFTPPCNIKILLTIDKNAKNADRGQSIIKRLTNLRSFFTDEEKLRSAISIVVNKQRISNGKALFESMGLFNIKPNTNEARDIAKATMTSEQDLVWVSSFLTHIRDNNRIFAFPEPKTIGPYNYGWFPDREGLIKALTTLPVHDPKINIFANFSQDPRTLLLMERAAGSLKSAIEGIKILFDTLRKSIPFDAGSLALAKTVIEQLNNLNENQINTPAKLASELRKRLIYFNAYINAAGQEECKKILDDLSSSEGYLILLDKMNKGDRAQRWRRDIPPIPETLKKFTSGSINDIVKVLNEMGSCCDGDNLNATKLALRAACTS